MTRKRVTDEEYGQLWRRMEEVARRVDEEAIPFDTTMRALQSVVEGKIKFAGDERVNAKPVGNLFPVEVDYSRSLADMISAGKYDWVNSDITEKNFPVKGEGRVTVNLELMCFNRRISSKDAITELKKLGMRPAKIEDLLAFGEKYPEEQRRYPIVALGSVWQSWVGFRDVAYLWGDAGDRRLGLSLFGHDWREGCRFLVVRES